MKLELQVCSSDLSKKLKELSIKQNGLFCWQWNCSRGIYQLFEKIEANSHGYPFEHYYSTFTVAELGEIGKGNGMGITAYSPLFKEWWCSGGEWIVEKQGYSHTETSDTEADARAKMLIYLIENKLIKTG